MVSLSPRGFAESEIVQAAWFSEDAQPAPMGICPDRLTPPPDSTATPPSGPGQGEGVQPPGQDAASAPSTDAFAQAPPAGGAETGGFNPNMFGDQLGILVQGPLTASVNGQTVVLTSGQFIPSSVLVPGVRFNFPVIDTSTNTVIPAGTPLSADQVARFHNAVVPAFTTPVGALAAVARGAAKITENESPRPQDRVFLTYNYFNNVNTGQNVPGLAQTDVHRGVIGFEKTFLGGNASVGLRVPFVQIEGDGSVRRHDFGDPSVVLKYAFINDRQTGNVLSGGLVVTAPFGASLLPQGVPDVHSTLLQPYLGVIYNVGEWYVQGFSSIIAPTDNRDVTSWQNDLAVGYFLYRLRESDRLLTSIVPTLEIHVTTPLNHRGAESQPIPGIDIVDLTAAVTFGLGRRSTVGLGIVTPLTGPRPFTVEGQLYLNCRF
jgi:hypothetical protein